MHIGMVSHYPAEALGDAEAERECRTLYRFTLALARHGLLRYWLCCTNTVAVLERSAHLSPAADDILPATCRYVVPYRLYHLAERPLLSVASDVWQQRDMQTRLFTLVDLLQGELPCTALHTWGSVPVLYLSVYTARFLRLPAVVSCGSLNLRQTPQPQFEWRWLAGQSDLMLLMQAHYLKRLLRSRGVTPARVTLMHDRLLTDTSAQRSLYERLGHSSSMPVASIPCQQT